MTLPKMPLKEWLSSSSSPQNVDQKDGMCRLLLSSPFSSRKRTPKSPPSSDPEDGEKWLQEARAFSLKMPFKPFSGRHAAWHAGGIRVVIVQKFGACCYSEFATVLHAAIYALAWSPA